MIWRRKTIHVNASRSSACRSMETLMPYCKHIYSPSQDKFTCVMWVKKEYNSIFIGIKVNCFIKDNGNMCDIKYVMRPTYIWFFVSACFLGAFLYALIHMLFFRGSHLFFILSCIFPIFNILNIPWQESICADRLVSIFAKLDSDNI